MTARSEGQGGHELPRDAGISLMELIVSMAIFTVVIAVFMSGLLVMTQGAVRAQDVTDAGDAARKSFQTMDKQIRYASSINLPGVGASGAHYVEFLTTAVPDGGDPLCTQWRYDPTARVLEYRTWRDLPTGGPSAWRHIAGDVRNQLTGAAAQPPFVLERAGATTTRQKLLVTIDVGRGPAGADQVVGADVATAFVARNSSDASPSNADLNLDGVSDTPVCTTHLERP